jgi:broad specificity phosphatase PhoE
MSMIKTIRMWAGAAGRTWLPAAATVWCLLGTSGVSLFAQSSVFLVRHAERADTANGAAPAMGADPDLSEAGRARADSLAAALRNAGITAIFATEYKRTQQTAAPLAKRLGIPVTTIPSKDSVALAGRINAASGVVLVVGHSNTIPEVIKLLGVDTPITIDDAEYDNLFVLVRGGNPTLIRLHLR